MSVNIGIVGTGRAAILHAEACKIASDVELAGLASRTPLSPHTMAVARSLGCASMRLSQLVRKSAALIIASPPATHIEIAKQLAESKRLRAVLVESPCGTTITGIDILGSILQDEHVVSAANFLHAPVIRCLLDVVANMDPHHLQLRLSVPTPDRGLNQNRKFGGGVLLDPGCALLPVLIAALGETVQSVDTVRLSHVNGLDRAVKAIVHGIGERRALIDLSWGAEIAECSVEIADLQNVARVEMWPVPSLEINGEPQTLPIPARISPLVGLGFVGQVQQLASIAKLKLSNQANPTTKSSPPKAQQPAKTEPSRITADTSITKDTSVIWPDLHTSRTALAITVAAALSAKQGRPVELSEIPNDVSPFEVLTSNS